MPLGSQDVIKDVLSGDFTTVMKSPLFDLLPTHGKENHLLALNLAEYEVFFGILPKPLMQALERKPWTPDHGTNPSVGGDGGVQRPARAGRAAACPQEHRR